MDPASAAGQCMHAHPPLHAPTICMGSGLRPCDAQDMFDPYRTVKAPPQRDASAAVGLHALLDPPRPREHLVRACDHAGVLVTRGSAGPGPLQPRSVAPLPPGLTIGAADREDVRAPRLVLLGAYGVPVQVREVGRVEVADLDTRGPQTRCAAQPTPRRPATRPPFHAPTLPSDSPPRFHLWMVWSSATLKSSFQTLKPTAAHSSVCTVLEGCLTFSRIFRHARALGR